jgi:uncharacterized protein (UPF0333 family)
MCHKTILTTKVFILDETFLSKKKKKKVTNAYIVQNVQHMKADTVIHNSNALNGRKTEVLSPEIKCNRTSTLF